MFGVPEQKKDELLAQAGMQTVAVQEQRARQMAELNERLSRLRAGEGDEAGAAAMQILDESADQEKEYSLGFISHIKSLFVRSCNLQSE